MITTSKHELYHYSFHRRWIRYFIVLIRIKSRHLSSCIWIWAVSLFQMLKKFKWISTVNKCFRKLFLWLAIEKLWIYNRQIVTRVSASDDLISKENLISKLTFIPKSILLYGFITEPPSCSKAGTDTINNDFW